MSKIGYESTINDFLQDDENKIFGELNKQFPSEDQKQQEAWISQIKILQNDHLSQFEDGSIIFEYEIPGTGKRIDNVLLINGIIFVLEFKVGYTTHQNKSKKQLDSYIRLLRNYHSESQGQDKLIVPILVSTKAEKVENIFENYDSVFSRIEANENDLLDIILEISNNDEYKRANDLSNWSKSLYSPTDAMLKTARDLYRRHDEKDFKQHNSEDIFLNKTYEEIDEIIDDTIQNNKKSIIFVTGTPGSGKTLVGLDVVMRRSLNVNSLFLSGNGPLMKVLIEQLISDGKKRNNTNKQEAKDAVLSLIRPLKDYMNYRKDRNNKPEHNIIIFDEAQRAWTKQKVNHQYDMYVSQPEFLVRDMNKHDDGTVIICLVGQGQEINDGERGIDEWFEILGKYPDWDVYANKKSSKVKEDFKDMIIDREYLNLYTTIRSLNSPNLPNFIEHVLYNEKDKAVECLNEFKNNYPIFITRDLKKAKKWVKSKSSPNEEIRYGLLAHSGAKRLRPEGIFVKKMDDPTKWFLNDSKDIRSSNYLEIPATEFDIQGLEIDYSILAWDTNLSYHNGTFNYYKFHGTKWIKIKEEDINKDYLINSYRVLLTRARRGMVIFVPEGDDEDETRKTEFYDGTYEYLKSIGIEELK